MKEWFFSYSTSVYPRGVKKIREEMLNKYEADRILVDEIVHPDKCELFVQSFPRALTFFKKGV